MLLIRFLSEARRYGVEASLAKPKLGSHPTSENLDYEANVEHGPRREKRKRTAITAVLCLAFPGDGPVFKKSFLGRERGKLNHE